MVIIKKIYPIMNGYEMVTYSNILEKEKLFNFETNIEIINWIDQHKAIKFSKNLKWKYVDLFPDIGIHEDK